MVLSKCLRITSVYSISTFKVCYRNLTLLPRNLKHMIYLSFLKAGWNRKSRAIGLTNFHSSFRRDRRDRPGRGVVIYVRDDIYCKRRSDLELQGLEAVWIERSIKSKKLLIGGCYKPPNSNSVYFDLLSESIDRAYNTNIIDIFILRDFNYNLQNNNVYKMTELIQEYSLTQLITEVTHYTENSSSVSDRFNPCSQ